MDSNNALAGKRVLITRPAPRSGAFAAALQAAGAVPVVAPVIAFEAPDDPKAAQAAAQRAHEYDWIVFTSATGVEAFFAVPGAALGRARIAAIGSGTARALESHGLEPALVPDRFIAEDLAGALIGASRPGARVLIYRAQEARDVLPDLLRDAGRVPHVVAAYKTVPLIDAEFARKLQACDVVTFTSASTVNGFVKNGGTPQAAGGKIVACIGPITADAARAAGFHVDIVAETFSVQGLCAALQHHA